MKNKFIVIFLAIILIVSVGFIFFNQNKKINPPLANNSGLKSLPCAPASRVELGYPSEGGSVAEFTSSGKSLFIEVKYFDHTGLFGSLAGLSAINLGNIDNLPELDKQRNIIKNSIKKISVPEKEYVEFQLPAGRYWLWSSAGGDIVVYSCEAGGVSDGKRVR
jgi:hypothetical protein